MAARSRRTPEVRGLSKGAGGLLIGSVLLGATLGYVGFGAVEFWRNRHMSPCASAGLLDDEVAGVQRSSRSQLQEGFAASAAAGGGVGLVFGLAAWLVSFRRGRRMAALLEEPDDEAALARRGKSIY
jgi:hypothetical protein